MSILRKYPFGLDLALWVHVRINIRVYKCKFGLAPKLQHSLITNSIKKALKERQKIPSSNFCEKKIFIFCFLKEWNYCIKVRFRLLWMKFECWKKADDMNRAIPESNYEKNKTKNLWIREITVVMLLPVQSNLWL